MSISANNRFKLLVLSILLVLSSTAWSADITEGQQLFEKRCAACHKLPDPAQPPAVGWEKQLEKMGLFAQLKKAQKQEVLEFLLSHSRDAAKSASLEEDRALFEEKCSHCHTLNRIFLEPLHGDDLQHVVSRMQSKSGTDWLSDEEIARILAYLGNAPSEAAPATALDGNATPEQLFSARCSGCHSLERIFSKLGSAEGSADFWSHTVSRMRGKAPQWMPESEANQILEYLQSAKPSQ